MAWDGTQSQDDTSQDCSAALDVCTSLVQHDPYNFSFRMDRAAAYNAIGFPDLAAADAYKALLLIDEATDDSGEYHELASRWLAEEEDDFNAICQDFRVKACTLIARCLLVIGCLRSAHDFAERMRATDGMASSLLCKQIAAADEARTSTGSSTLSENIATQLDHVTIHSDRDQPHHNSKDLPDRGCVRREIYSWNNHEHNRTTDEALELLNEQMTIVAPCLEVKATDLPSLTSLTKASDSEHSQESTVRQLGVFAKQDLSPGQEILEERSLLTANARLHEPMCDACSALLPETAMGMGMSDNAGEHESQPVACPDCDDIIFCSEQCLELAQKSYHPAVCGMDVEALSKDVPPTEAADALYTLLLYRALAMSQTQGLHPLDLAEVKYIWGDFEPVSHASPTDKQAGEDLFLSRPRTLPFSFEDNIMAPLHMLEKMDIDIFASPNDIAEPWVWTTLYAKFRGTASARISPRDGRPEVAAVHPLWCLANHSCDPTVQWDWAGKIKFTVRGKRKTWQRQGKDGSTETRGPADAVIKAGEEIWNHYVDIDIPVQDRREWGAGALGGACRCERCKWEACETN